MRTRFSRHWKWSGKQELNGRRPGLTLIEVIASIALLATLLVMMLSIRSSLVRQANRAFESQKATAALDMQLAQWFEFGGTVPVNETGNLEGTEEFYWRTNLVPTRSSNSNWQMTTIRVEAISAITQQPVASVELAGQPATTERATGGQSP